MKSLLAFLTGGSLATAWLGDDPATQCIAAFFALYAGFTWTRFHKIESRGDPIVAPGCGGDCGQGRRMCDCRGGADG